MCVRVSHSCCQPASTYTIRETICVWLLDRTTRRPFLRDAAWAMNHHRHHQIQLTLLTVIRIPEYILLCRRMYTKGGQQDHIILIGGRRALTGTSQLSGKPRTGRTAQKISLKGTWRERRVTGADIRHGFRGVQEIAADTSTEGANDEMTHGPALHRRG